MRSFIVVFIIILLSVPGFQAQNPPAAPKKDKHDQYESFDIMMKRMSEQLRIAFDSVDFEKLFSEAFGSLELMIDTSMMKNMFGENFNLYFEDMGPSLDGESFESLMEEAMGMLKSMDESEIQSLMDQIDLSQLEFFFDGMKMNELDSILRGMDIKLPENYIDSIRHSQEQKDKQKKLKRI